MKRGGVAIGRRGLSFTVGALALGGTLVVACGGGDPPPLPPYGTPCNGTVACASGLQCLPTNDGTGYCTTTCDSAPCPMGTVCNGDFGASVCLASCARDSECSTPDQCWMGRCQPACATDAQCGSGTCTAGRCSGPECSGALDCGAGMTCSGGRCVPQGDGGGLMLADGQACTASTDCASGHCLPPDRGGVCTSACLDGDICFTEAFTATCAPALVDGVVGTYCIPFLADARPNASACASNADCQNQTCIESQCRDVCRLDAQCVLGQHCTSIGYATGTFMGCGYDPGPASGTEVRVVPLGDFTVRASTGTPDIVFATPPNTISVMLRAVQTGGDPLDMFFYDVFDATGAHIYSLNDMAMYVDQTIRWYPFDATSAVAMLIPNTTTDRYTYSPGRMHFGVAAYPETMGGTGTVNMHVDAVEVIAATPPTSGVLNLRVHLVGVGITAASAPGNARITTFLARLGEVLGGAGITIGTTSFVDISAPALEIIDTADGESSELSQLFRMSTGTTENVLNLFLVQEVRAGGTGEFNTLGIAGGIPGPARVHGSSHSGVVIAFDPGVVGPGTGGARLAGGVAAHECSHFLGLFHTTENGRPCSAGETPSAADPCVPFGGTDVIGDTTYGDTSNLMNFSIVGAADNDRITAGQAFVELRNPLTH